MPDYPSLVSFWIAARGEQVINCELLVPAEGQTILRCRYGAQAVIRSQLIASADAAADVAATWKTALEEQGFRIIPARPHRPESLLHKPNRGAPTDAPTAR